MPEPRNINDIIGAYLSNQTTKPTKPTKQVLSIAQKESLNNRLQRLTPQFKKAIIEQNLDDAKVVTSDLQQVLRTLNKTTKLVEFKNQLFELALEKEQYSFAIEGFLSNRSLINEKTRLYLEATALLAIAYLRTNEVEKAKPCIKEVLQNKNVIKTDATKEKFNKEIIARFDEESALYSLKVEKKVELEIEEFNENVIKAFNSFTEEQLFSTIGRALPKVTKDLLFEVDQFSKRQLTYKEQKLLPPPEDIIKDEQAGRTVFSALKRVVYKSLCDPNSEVYKIWYNNAVGVVVDRKYIAAAIGLVLTGSGIGVSALLISAAALVMRFGLDIYCERYKPTGITEFRRKSD